MAFADYSPNRPPTRGTQNRLGPPFASSELWSAPRRFALFLAPNGTNEATHSENPLGENGIGPSDKRINPASQAASRPCVPSDTSAIHAFRCQRNGTVSGTGATC